jgi:MoaA/NifB/PqqE/SkfB family radical SAM enzyme
MTRGWRYPFAELSTVTRAAHRRQSWLFDQLSTRKAFNLLINIAGYAVRAKSLPSVPSIVKIDISPLCSLQCPVCVHAAPDGRKKPLLDAQSFKKSDKMAVSDFRSIIEKLEGKALAVSLFYFGDPLMHPNLAELCGIARSAGLNVHITTHFSYNLSDAAIAELADCGITHMTVALDGASQAVYGATRIRGRLDWVVSNLRRLGSYKRAHNCQYPILEVQYIAHPHHPAGEQAKVRAIATECGANHFTKISPYPLDNVVDDDPELFRVGASRPQGVFPKCPWPYTSIVIKHNGDVIPCCNYRAGRQHANADEQRTAGNIFRSSLKEIWNGKAYQNMRRLVANPSRVDENPSYKESFCYGCPVIAERSRKQRYRSA